MKATKQETKEPKIRSRRIFQAMFGNCPLCDAPLHDVSEMTPVEKQKFYQVVQFGSNADGTGYESYFCGICQKFFMMIIAETPIQVTPVFSEGLPPRGQRTRSPFDPPDGGPTACGSGMGTPI